MRTRHSQLTRPGRFCIANKGSLSGRPSLLILLTYDLTPRTQPTSPLCRTGPIQTICCRRREGWTAAQRRRRRTRAKEVWESRQTGREGQRLVVERKRRGKSQAERTREETLGRGRTAEGRRERYAYVNPSVSHSKYLEAQRKAAFLLLLGRSSHSGAAGSSRAM